MAFGYDDKLRQQSILIRTQRPSQPQPAYLYSFQSMLSQQSIQGASPVIPEHPSVVSAPIPQPSQPVVQEQPSVVSAPIPQPSQPVVQEQPATDNLATITTAKEERKSYDPLYHEYVGQGVFRNVVRLTDGEIVEVQTGKSPLSNRTQPFRPIRSGLEIQDMRGSGIAEEAAIGFGTGVFGAVLSPVTVPVSLANLARETYLGGTGVLAFKAKSTASSIVQTAKERPSFFAGSVAGTLAGGKLLGGVIKDIREINAPKAKPVASVGVSDSRILLKENDASFGVTNAKFKTTDNKIITSSQSQFKTLDKGDISLTAERGVASTLIKRDMLSKIARKDVYTKKTDPFVAVGMSKEVSENIFRDAYRIKTEGGMTSGSGASIKFLSTERNDFFKSLSASNKNPTLVLETIRKLPKQDIVTEMPSGSSVAAVDLAIPRITSAAAKMHRIKINTIFKPKSAIVPVYVKPVQLQEPAQSKITIQKQSLQTLQKQGQRQRTATIQTPITKQRQRTATAVAYRQDDTQRQKSAQASIQINRQDDSLLGAQASVTASSLLRTTINVPPRAAPTRLTPPRAPPIFGGGTDFFKSGIKSVKKTYPRAIKYAPSIGGILSKKRFKRPRINTGIFIRSPI